MATWTSLARVSQQPGKERLEGQHLPAGPGEGAVKHLPRRPSFPGTQTTRNSGAVESYRLPTANTTEISCWHLARTTRTHWVVIPGCSSDAGTAGTAAGEVDTAAAAAAAGDETEDDDADVGGGAVEMKSVVCLVMPPCQQ